jgi:hypothetical protein
VSMFAPQPKKGTTGPRKARRGAKERKAAQRVAKQEGRSEWLELSREVARLDHFKCQFPSCNAELGPPHHIIYRSHGGPDHPSNLISLCPAHHKAAHDGMMNFGKRYSGHAVMLSILGSLKADSRVRFRWTEAYNQLKKKQG